MSRPDEPRLLPVRALLHPLWLGACALLVVNDHVFKGAGIVHDLATGKLSDFAGMIVAPALLAALAGARSRGALAASHVAVGLGFAALQLGTGAQLAERLMAPLAWRIWPDPTDLVALPVLALSWRVLVPAMERPRPVRSALRENTQLGALVVGLLACLGTSAVPPEPPPQPPGELLVAEEPPLDGTALHGRWRSAEAGGYEQYRFDGDRYVATGHPAFEESGRFQVVEVEGGLMRVRLVDRRHNGQADEPLEVVVEPLADGSRMRIGDRRYDRVVQQMAASTETEMADEIVPTE